MNASLFYDIALNASKMFCMPNFSGLLQYLPVFPVFSSQIKFLNKPQEFYNELLSQVSSANKRIVVASLYLGTGKLERILVDTILKQLHSCPELRVCWLLDYTRALRGNVNSCSVLLPLIQNRNHTCKVSLYHTPDLRGFRKLILPQRWNEIIGLQHMKIYVFDNSVVLSGANLSNDYFVNRQDRYVVIRDCEELADFYDDLVSLLSAHSLQLGADSSIGLAHPEAIHPYLGNRLKYTQAVRHSIRTFWEEEMRKSSYRAKELGKKLKESGISHPDTLLFPSIQIPPCGVTIDSEATAKFLKSTPQGSKIHLATGYFNLTDQFANILLRESHSKVDILCAHPKANGFLGAKGFAGGIPAAYTNLCKQFYRKIVKNSLTEKIRVYEFQREGWTFHAKGLWYIPPGDLQPSATLIGSPNFGHRSVHRDLETNLFVTTTSPSLRREMAEEEDVLYKQAALVTLDTFNREDRIVPLWVKLVTLFFKYFF